MKKFLVAVLVLIVLAGAGALAYAMRHPALAPIAKPDPAKFDKKLLKDGEQLAGLGNCHVCHTAPGGQKFAGGLALPTPFGVIHTTNITPDVETGIGDWSEEAFIRAMREGVDREGHYLYPVFPYDYYAKASDADLKAIYAFLMSLPAVSAKPKENGLSFPFNIRLLLAGWNFLFHDSTPFKPDQSKDAEWNRGAYIVESLGHCGACHSPRNIFGAAAKTGPNAYGGGVAEGWYVPPLNASTPAPIPWTSKSMVNYLIDGWDGYHGIAAGPMTAVATDLYDQKEDDVFAIASYVMSLKGPQRPQAELDKIAADALAAAQKLEWGHPNAPAVPNDPVMQKGAKVFEAQCSTCHKQGGKPAPLGLATVVHAPDASNLVLASFYGIQPPRGVLDRSMPPRASQISDDEMVELAAFIRARFTSKPAWTGLEATVKTARHGGH